MPKTTQQGVNIERLISEDDKDNDGTDDFTDIVESAREQIGVVTSYDIAYYTGGYPPEHSGACSDVIWRALQGAGYDLKSLIDTDIRKYPDTYPKNSITDSNINFRRVLNVKTFLEKYTQSLTTQIIPWDTNNLQEWQGGDIVTYEQIPGGLWHVAIISDKRREDGVPLLIHNYGLGVLENDYLLEWPAPLSGHYRFLLQKT
jgi:uncharacterized protein YijF (DUF1287 family)